MGEGKGSGSSGTDLYCIILRWWHSFLKGFLNHTVFCCIVFPAYQLCVFLQLCGGWNGLHSYGAGRSTQKIPGPHQSAGRGSEGWAADRGLQVRRRETDRIHQWNRPDFWPRQCRKHSPLWLLMDVVCPFYWIHSWGRKELQLHLVLSNDISASGNCHWHGSDNDSDTGTGLQLNADMIMKSLCGDSETDPSDGCRLFRQLSLVLAHCAQIVECPLSILIPIFLPIIVTHRRH